MVIHLQHPADEGGETYRALARRATLCWNMKAGCSKTSDPDEVTCKQCLKMMALKAEALHQ